MGSQCAKNAHKIDSTALGSKEAKVHVATRTDHHNTGLNKKGKVVGCTAQSH